LHHEAKAYLEVLVVAEFAQVVGESVGEGLAIDDGPVFAVLLARSKVSRQPLCVSENT
jgi:hypothetical protein